MTTSASPTRRRSCSMPSRHWSRGVAPASRSTGASAVAERVAEIYSLLVPLVDGRLIIPRACVAEVVGFQTPSEMTGAPPWYIGTVPWNGKAVPLVSFEGACGQMIPPASGRTRIGGLHALGTAVEGGNFALVSQGFPQLVRVSSDVVRPDNSRVFPERAPVICQVRMVNETPLVPDLARLADMLAGETRAPAHRRRRSRRSSMNMRRWIGLVCALSFVWVAAAATGPLPYDEKADAAAA